MEYWKKHNQDNIAEERFNQIKNYCDDWIWEKNSVAILSGDWYGTSNWNSASDCGSRASEWHLAPSVDNSPVAIRCVCNHRIVK